MKYFSILITLLSLESCSQKPKIEITSEYIFNEYWRNSFTNSFMIEKMIVKKDSVLNILEPSFSVTANSQNVVDKLENDSSFVYKYISLNENKTIGETIYFDKPNNGFWYATDLRSYTLLDEIEIIGNLQKKSWYKISDLRGMQFFKYVYVDSTGKTHSFDRNLANY